MRVKFTFPYNTDVLEDGHIDALNVAGIDPPLSRGEDGRIPTYYAYECDLQKVLAILPSAIRVELQGAGDPRAFADLVEEVRALNVRLSGRAASPGSYVNNRMDVHVPGNALLSIDEVAIHEDLCTDALNDLLQADWRIVAVCPQPDQRRPDYVLGRRTPLVVEEGEF